MPIFSCLNRLFHVLLLCYEYKNLTEVEAMNESMLDRLVSMENRYEELGHMLMDPDIGTDIKKMTDVTKEQASLQAAYDLFQEYKEVKDGIDGAKELMKENEKIFVVKIGNRNYAHKLLLDKWLLAQVRK